MSHGTWLIHITESTLIATQVFVDKASGNPFSRQSKYNCSDEHINVRNITYALRSFDCFGMNALPTTALLFGHVVTRVNVSGSF